MRRRWRVIAPGIADERGVALVMALLVLVVLSSLMASLALLAQSEPVIASNQYRTAAARAMAESGVERAIWALSLHASDPAAPAALAPPASGAVAAAPYDGVTFVQLTPLGGFTVRVTGVSATRAGVDATGWQPSPTSALIKAHRRVQATLMRFPDFGSAAPCALCVRGRLSVRGHAAIHGHTDTSCGNKYGSYSRDTTDIGDSASVYGADGNTTPNEASDAASGQSTASFDPFTLDGDQLDALRAIAKANGTYSQGAVTFDASNPVPDGVVFVDTVSGANITDSTPTSDYASASITGNATSSSSGWRGWLIVNGSLVLTAGGTFNGMIYAVNGIDAHGSTPVVNGLVVSQNIRDDTLIDTAPQEAATIAFDCASARGTGVIPPGWFVKAGSYREVSD